MGPWDGHANNDYNDYNIDGDDNDDYDNNYLIDFNTLVMLLLIRRPGVSVNVNGIVQAIQFNILRQFL